MTTSQPLPPERLRWRCDPDQFDFVTTEELPDLDGLLGQPIGGVNEKVEGFFDVCQATRLTGDQGVLIPAANAKHLMLRHDVVEASLAGTFAVYTYETIDEAITLLTDVDAGTRGTDGVYPADSVNYLVDRRLRELADLQRSFAEKSEEDLE